MKIAVENFRSFKKTNIVDLSRINLFIGPNGSGKSSFLRILPLLKQSVRTQHSSPILWAYNNYLDFGNFKTTSFNNSQTMTFTISNTETVPYVFRRLLQGKKRLSKLYENHVTFTIAKMSNFTEYVKSIELKMWDNKIKITTVKSANIVFIKTIRINDYTFKFENTKLYLKQTDIQTLPIIITDQSEKLAYSRYSRFSEILNDEIIEMFISEFGELRFNIKERNQNNIETLKEFYLNNILKEEKLSKHDYSLIDYILTSDNISLKEINLSKLKMLIRYRILVYINEYIQHGNVMLNTIANSVTYLAPFRAQAERYYMAQDLIDNELDSKGFNIPSYLTIMKANNSSKFKKLNNWLNENFHFEVDLKFAGNHTQLRIFEGGNLSNIADTGFGYSQVLPLLVYLWEISETKVEKILIVEQPELHLHPKLQAMFIDAVVNVSTNNKYIKILLETHSETIINRVGQHVRRFPELSDIVSVYIIEKTKESKIRRTQFNKDGLIMDWPTNFLSPGELKNDN